MLTVSKQTYFKESVCLKTSEDGEDVIYCKTILPGDLVVSTCGPVKSNTKPTQWTYCSIVIVVHVPHLEHRIIQLSNKVWIPV